MPHGLAECRRKLLFVIRLTSVGAELVSCLLQASNQSVQIRLIDIDRDFSVVLGTQC